MDELRRVATVDDALLALVQEPYGIRGTFNALGLKTRCLFGKPLPAGRYGSFQASDTPQAIITVFSRAVDILLVHDLSDSYIVVAQVASSQAQRAYFISAYFPSSACIEPFVGRLNHVIMSLDTRFPIVLEVMQMADRGPTFNTVNGSSFIDVTAVNTPSLSYFDYWRLDWTPVPSTP